MKLDTLDYGSKASVTTQTLQAIGIDNIAFDTKLSAYNQCHVTATTDKGATIPLGAYSWSEAADIIKDVIMHTPEGCKALIDNLARVGE